jgi:hypothetical protein
MQHKFINKKIVYDGSQLRSHFNYEVAGLKGDSIISFTGPADVRTDNLVDLDDKNAGLFIYSPSMLHFIIEHFEPGLDLIIARQRIFMVLACEALNGLSLPSVVERIGDDLFFDDRKLSVSIATCSPVSTLIHAGLNIETIDTPVPASGLQELGVKAGEFARILMERYMDEIEGMKHAGWKIRSVP